MTKEEKAIILLSEHIDTSNYRNGAELEEALFIIADAIRHQSEEKMTNRKKINNMSNVELSIFISETFMTECNEQVCAFKFDDTCCNKYLCAEGVLRWLESEEVTE